MSATELIDRLTCLVKLQADIIKTQAEVLAQVGAVVMEEERTGASRTLTALIGYDADRYEGTDRKE